MKKYFIIMLLAVVCQAANAQFYVGGSLTFSSTKVEDAKAVNTLGIAPEVGYQINKTWAVGLGLDWESNLDNTNMYALSPYVRANFAKAGPVNFFAELNGNVGSIKVDDFDSKSLWGIGVGPGIMVNVSPKVALVTRTNLLSVGSIGDANYTKFGINSGVNLGIIFRL